MANNESIYSHLEGGDPSAAEEEMERAKLIIFDLHRWLMMILTNAESDISSAWQKQSEEDPFPDPNL